MYSNFVAFESILDIVKDDTGITILKNDYPKIRRLMYRAEKDIGYGGSVMLKRVKYSIEAGSILYDGKNYKARIPENVIRLEAIGMCAEGVCPGDYRIQGNWIFFCDGGTRDSFNLLYYTLIHDGEGNPVTTENHSEAVAAGISYWLYKARVFNKKANANMLQYYENYYHDRIGEARGDDIWPETQEEWSKMARILQWSSRDVLIYSEKDRCFCEVPEEIAEIYAPVAVSIGGGAGYTDPATVTPGGGGAGDGSSVPETVDETNPVSPNPDIPSEPEPPVNQDPTIDDITFYTTNGFTTPITWAMFIEGAPAPYNDPEGDLMDAVRFDALKFDNKGKWFYQGLEMGVEVPFGTVAFKANFDAGDLIHIAWNQDDFNEDVLYFSVRDNVNGNWVN